MVLETLQQHRMLLIWDNFESVCSLPDPSGATPPLDDEHAKRCGVPGRAGGRRAAAALIITSRSPEDWLGQVRRLELGGLTPLEAAELADDVLAPYPRARRGGRSRALPS